MATAFAESDGVGIPCGFLFDLAQRRPIDLLRESRPILILDEPQKMEGKATAEKLAEFNPLMILRYSATHRTTHHKIYCLDALEAFRRKLVKKISVCGITVGGFSGAAAYLYLELIRTSLKRPPEARMEIEFLQKNGIGRRRCFLKRGDDLFDLSGGLEPYRGFVVLNIDALENIVSFTNGAVICVGEAWGNVDEASLRRIQIRETIKAHLEKERRLFDCGVKVLSLFFIDEVAGYRHYGPSGETPGEYARIFEEEYRSQLEEILKSEETPYHRYLRSIRSEETHHGYFSIDRKTGRMTNPMTKPHGRRPREAETTDAYELILRDRSRLLSLTEPVRFLFSHSALREGWDNPNVFVICTLKHSDSTIFRRQEVGRGMRLAVNQEGERMDDPATVHQINVLTVIANESYRDFVSGLQREIVETSSLSGAAGQKAGVADLPEIEDERATLSSRRPADCGEEKFHELWMRLCSEADCCIDFDIGRLITDCAAALDRSLRVSPLHYLISSGEQINGVMNDGFRSGRKSTERLSASPIPDARYDLIGRLAEPTQLTRRTLTAMLCAVSPAIFEQFKVNPEEFIRKAGVLINQQMTMLFVGHLTCRSDGKAHKL